MLIVQKYGGTSLADVSRIHSAARRVADLARQGHQLVVVVSAQGDTTDLLIRHAHSICPEPSGREMDACLASGEQLSAALMAMAIGDAGYPAVSLTGWQAGIETTEDHGNARILNIRCPRISQELSSGKAVVVAGFQGISPEADITTLGRGGSDTTAVALAVWLKADRCQIFTDVDGVYDRDPRLCPDAIRFQRLGYERMLSLIEKGAQVLHGPCVELARDHRLELEVLSAFTGSPGTVVGDLESF